MMMAENLVENQICSACGAAVRPQALFCYNCGSAVAPEIETAPDEATGEVWSDEIADERQAETTKLNTDAGEIDAPPIGKPTDTLIENKAEKTFPPPPQTETKLKSAAALRRSGRVAPQKKTVEVIWEEPENAPNVWFLVVAFVLALFAVGILLAMLYIR
jgi:hypothetical protein